MQQSTNTEFLCNNFNNRTHINQTTKMRIFPNKTSVSWDWTSPCKKSLSASIEMLHLSNTSKGSPSKPVSKSMQRLRKICRLFGNGVSRNHLTHLRQEGSQSPPQTEWTPTHPCTARTCPPPRFLSCNKSRQQPKTRSTTGAAAAPSERKTGSWSPRTPATILTHRRKRSSSSTRRIGKIRRWAGIRSTWDQAKWWRCRIQRLTTISMKTQSQSITSKMCLATTYRPSSWKRRKRKTRQPTTPSEAQWMNTAAGSSSNSWLRSMTGLCDSSREVSSSCRSIRWTSSTKHTGALDSRTLTILSWCRLGPGKGLKTRTWWTSRRAAEPMAPNSRVTWDRRPRSDRTLPTYTPSQGNRSCL